MRRRPSTLTELALQVCIDGVQLLQLLQLLLNGGCMLCQLPLQAVLSRHCLLHLLLHADNGILVVCLQVQSSRLRKACSRMHPQLHQLLPAYAVKTAAEKKLPTNANAGP